ncbi:phasin family protein [Janthinobacterium sp. 1_2014MBL_MicDiv]|uniref:phasin family protein n=1 Tax=Janthinobacterium sp. 1_2014MBL_MicDiv TaxID=1644131 RepID=UPI0008F4F880|nr:phasin family protein [Janthinobacterium sp. 1_2014MBL_MicDiv]
MFPIPEQFSNAAKSQLESQLQIFSTITSKVFESAEKIIALNLNAGKAALSHTAETAQHLLETQDPRDFFSYSSSQAQPNIESVLAYSRQLFGIASSTQAELLASAKARLDEAAPAPVAAKPTLAVVAPASKPAAVPAPVPAPAAAAAPVVAQPAPAQPVEVTKPVAKAAPAAAPAPAPAAKAADKPAAKAVEAKPVAKPEAVKPAPAPAATPAKAAAAPAVAKPAAKPLPPSKPAAKPASAASKTVTKAAVKPAHAPAAKPAAKGTPSKQLDMLGGGKGSGRK